MSKIFITGGTGCIGAATVFKLLTVYGDQVEQIRIASRSSNTEQLEIWLGDELREYVDAQKISFVKSTSATRPRCVMPFVSSLRRI